MWAFIFLFLLPSTSLDSNSKSKADTSRTYNVPSSYKINFAELFGADSQIATADSFKLFQSYVSPHQLNEVDSFVIKFIDEHYPINDNYLIKASSQAMPKDLTPKNKYAGLLRVSTTKTWEIYFLVLIIALVTLLLNVYAAKAKQAFGALSNNRNLQLILKEDGFFKFRHNILLYLWFSLFFSYLVFKGSVFLLSKEVYAKNSIWNTFLLVQGFFIIKYFLSYIIGILFDYPKTVQAQLSVFNISHWVFGLLALPFILFYEFSTPAHNYWYLIVILVIWLLLAIYKYIRAVSFISEYFKFPSLYIIVYLCTFEILPLLLLLKVLV